GFRLNYDYLESGEARGGFSSSLIINDTFVGGSHSRVELDLTRDCPNLNCRSFILLDGVIMASVTTYNASLERVTVDIPTYGRHSIEISFDRLETKSNHHLNDSGQEERDATSNLRIYAVRLYGTVDGGAPECIPCPEGFAVDRNTSTC